MDLADKVIVIFLVFGSCLITYSVMDIRLQELESKVIINDNYQQAINDLQTEINAKQNKAIDTLAKKL